MKIKNKKDICAYVYKELRFLFDEHPTTKRNSLRGYRQLKRKNSNFSIVRRRVESLQWEKSF